MMYRHEFFVQSREYPRAIHRGLSIAARSAEFSKMIVAVAYATKPGCKLLAETLSSNVGWRKMVKRWLISIDHGITEPEALVFLASLPNSEVRIPNAEAVLASRLKPATRFHHKFYFFQGRADEGALALFSGSANLTLSGLCVNNEQGSAFVLTPPFSNSDRSNSRELIRQVRILDTTFDSAPQLTDELLTRYRALWRPRKISDDETWLVRNLSNPTPGLSLTRAVVIATTPSFWVQIRYVVPNLGQGVPGNQIDLPRGSRVFFGLSAKQVPRNTLLGTVLVRFEGQVYPCHMRFGNNSMDKLNLPRLQGHQTYKNKTLLFQRNEDRTFRISMGAANDIGEWRRRSEQQGTLFRMVGGREYGVFS